MPAFRTSAVRIGAAVALALWGSAAAAEVELNRRDHLDPATGAKVQRFIARSWRLDRDDDVKIRVFGNGDTAEDTVALGLGAGGCGNQVIGTVVSPRGGRGPREITTIITGDAVNVVRPGACR